MTYQDIADMHEDDRIKQIGDMVMQGNKTVAFVTDDEPGKAERYINKLQERYPGIRVVGVWSGPVDNTTTVKMGPPMAGPPLN